MLSWSAVPEGRSYRIFFGTDVSTIADLSVVIDAGQPAICHPGLAPNTKYFWRVDVLGPTDYVLGTVWSFTTPGPRRQSLNPNPPDGATQVGLIRRSRGPTTTRP